MDPVESTMPRSSPSSVVTKVLSQSFPDDVEESLPIPPLEEMIVAFVDGGNEVLKDEDVSQCLPRFHLLRLNISFAGSECH
jgi:hypothetical protein